MYLYEKVSRISHIITFIISTSLSLYICINCLDLFINGLFWGDFVFLFCTLGFFYLIFFYPIDYTIRNLSYAIINDNFKYGEKDYIEDYKIEPPSPVGLYRKGIIFYAFYMVMFFIINIIIIIPAKFIINIIRNKEKEE